MRQGAEGLSTHSDLYEAKADFSAIYNQADPRSYFGTLGELGYEIPLHGPPVFDTLLQEMGGRAGKTVLDLCCSYGVNAALMNHEVSLAELYAHYDAAGGLDSHSLEQWDRRFYRARRRTDAVRTVGLDVADNALGYATAVGLVDDGVVADLEAGDCAEGDLALLGSADLVTITGGIGYIGGRTLRTIVEAAGDEPPWIAALSLRWIDFDPIAESLEEIGLVTERVPGYCVPQRRFAGEGERRAAVQALRGRGLDPTGELDADAHFADLVVIRPPEAVRRAPIGNVVGLLVDALDPA